MSRPRTPWLPEHDLILKKWSGRKSAAAIAKMTGHCMKTVLQHQSVAELQSYHHKRAGWSRRDYLLAGAAGLAIEDAPW